MAKKKIVLAYSGGLDTSVMIKWLQEQYNADVVTVTLDVGQGDNLKEIGEKAWTLGVVNHYTFDAKKEFVVEYVFPAIKANALVVFLDHSLRKKLLKSLKWKMLMELLTDVLGK